MLLRSFPVSAVPDKQRKVLDFIYLKKTTLNPYFPQASVIRQEQAGCCLFCRDAGFQSSTTCEVSDCNRRARFHKAQSDGLCRCVRMRFVSFCQKNKLNSKVMSPDWRYKAHISGSLEELKLWFTSRIHCLCKM